MLNSITIAARWPSATIRPRPHRTRPQSATNEYRQATASLSVSQAAAPPHTTLMRPSPMSIAPKAPAASTGSRLCARCTMTAASTGPANASHTTGEETSGSSGSIGWRYGRTPTPAARPATRPTAANRSMTSGPWTRAKNAPRPSNVTATTGPRSRTARGLLPPMMECRTPSASRASRVPSKVGTAAIAAAPTTPTPPLPSSSRLDAAGGEKATANARAAAARMTSSTASGCSNGPRGDPTGQARDYGGGQERPRCGSDLANPGGQGDRQGQQTNRGEEDGRLVRAEDSRSGQPYDHHRREPQGRCRPRRQRRGDPQGEQGCGDAEDQARGGAGRHDVPAPAARAKPPRRRDHPTQRNRCRRFRPGGVERDHRHARDAYGGAQRQTSPSIREDDDRGAQPATNAATASTTSASRQKQAQ